ncbi:MAG: SDR family oxidoreductase [Candidatus Symbiobacter sp.]|nr:SDR family oxidoreductase [Candidatus Symbiobacter sp.]
MKKIFCFGYGYSAQHLAPLLLAQGDEVAGTWQTRPPQTDPAVQLFRFAANEALSPEGLAALAAAQVVVISIPPVPRAELVAELRPEPDLVLAQHKAALAQENIKHIIYLSTTGVYGDHQGGWVDEQTPTAPQTERGHRRLAAEMAWRDFVQTDFDQTGAARGEAKKLTILRLAGIYGPGRSVFDTIRQGRAQIIVKPGQYFSRIHVADIAQFIHAVIAAAPSPQAESSQNVEVYNLADNLPAPPQDVIRQGFALLGRTPPPPIDFAQATLSPMQASFYSESKRIDNRRMREFLSQHSQKNLIYPEYHAGLAAIYATLAG